MKPFARKFYDSQAWKDCREAYIASVFGLCERCRGAGYIVHHKILLTPKNIDDPVISLNHAHLEYVCLNCHNAVHGKVKGCTRQGLQFNEFGQLEEVEDTPLFEEDIFKI